MDEASASAAVSASASVSEPASEGSHRATEPRVTEQISDVEEATPADLIGFIAKEEVLAEAAEAGVKPSRRESAKALARQLVKFGLVGGLGFIVETIVLNALLVTVLRPDTVDGAAIWAKIAATLVAIATNWIGNRLWTFRGDRRQDHTREGMEFLAASLLGLVVGLIPMWIATSVMGYTSLLAANIANIVGLVLGSVFRFLMYRFWVFAPGRGRAQK